jgi:AraC-like DNA-binding protein
MRGHLEREVFTYDVDHYLIVGFPLPVECEYEASLSKPLLFLSVDLDWSTLGTLIAEIGNQDAPFTESKAQAIRSTPLGDELRNCVTRLVECLRSPTDARVLGPALVREMYYRVLRDRRGEVLRAATAKHGRFSRIGKALSLIHSNYADGPSISDLAKSAGMSIPGFYRHFRVVLGVSPGRYIQAIRLHKARSLIIDEEISVSQAAARVGYESPSQFSREFRRLFGVSPSEDVRRARLGQNN